MARGSTDTSVGFFSRLRWGPGSIAIVVVLAIGAAASLAEACRSSDELLYFVGGVLAVVDAIIVAVKGLETITPAKVVEERLEGSVGVAVTDVGPKGGVVRVGGQLWSAVSDSPIPAGARVKVLGRDGLWLVVAPEGRAPRLPGPTDKTS